jgi:spermidine synthase
MSPPSQPTPARPAIDRALPVLLLLFVGSGCAALIYEIVWFQLLQFVIGSSAVSLGVLLGTFMGGMCLGSLALPRVIGPTWHPLRVYAVLELGIALIGVGIMFGLPYLDGLYSAIATQGGLSVLFRALVAAACLLPPTVLMGATLPAVARWVETTPRGVSWLGFFYGGNIAGAVAGCLLAGFYLLRVYDMTVATYVAATINAAVALVAFGVAAMIPARRATVVVEKTVEPLVQPPRAWSIYAAIGLSGLAALGAEVIWTRLLSLMIGGTVYTFSIILAVFLLGLGIGSSAGAALSRRYNPRLALGACQALLAAAIAWAAYQLLVSLPYWPIDPSLSHSPWHNFQLDLLRCTWAILPPALLWGASFPLALAAAASRGQDPGRLVGGVYAANTLGAIAGAVGFSTLIIPWLGTQDAQRLLIIVAALAALLALVPLVWLRRSAEGSSSARSPATVLVRGASLMAVLVAIGWFAWTIPPTSGELIAHGRYLPSNVGQDEIIYQGEGTNASVAVSLHGDSVRSFHVSGKVEASSLPQDMRLQRILGHIPALVHPKPKSVLVVGCGAGVTAGSFLTHPDVERIVICEIEPLIPQVVAQYFHEENYGVASQKERTDNKRVEIVYDDARHFIRTTNEKFDIITSDPIHPWVKGAATLYTKEYFELCKERLNPGGVITQWVPLYESTSAAVKSELATFFEVFPTGTVWSNDQDGEGYDIVLLGQVGPLKIDVDQLGRRLGGGDHEAVVDSLIEVGFESPLDLLATYAGAAADLAPWLADAEINRDRNLRLQYLAGVGAHNYNEAIIYDEMLRFRKYPEKLFVAGAASAGELKRKLGLIPTAP